MPSRKLFNDMKILRILQLIFVMLGSLWVPKAVCADPLELLTPAEAARPEPAAKDDAPLPVGSGPAPGAPQIIVDTPGSGSQVTTPFPVKIRFVPADGAKINLDTLKVDVLKLVPISLLSRVKPYLTAVGIDVPQAKIPAGTYHLRIAVTDDQGREGIAMHTWTVH